MRADLAERLAREAAIDRGLVPFDGSVRDGERRIAEAIREAVRECARVAALKDDPVMGSKHDPVRAILGLIGERPHE